MNQQTKAIVFIPLTQGKVAIIDFDDFEKIRPFKWFAHKGGRKAGKRTWYAKAYVKGSGRKSNLKILMHRLILDAPSDIEVDHEDTDGLNNQRDNIRKCSHMQNCQAGRKKSRRATSLFRGVSWNKRDCVFVSFVAHNYAGSFSKEEDAARAYDKKAKELFGEFAQLNFP